MTITPSGARSPVEMLSGWTVAIRALSCGSSGSCSGGVLMLGPRGISIRSASSSGAGGEDVAVVDVGLQLGHLEQLGRVAVLARVADLARAASRPRPRPGEQR